MSKAMQWFWIAAAAWSLSGNAQAADLVSVVQHALARDTELAQARAENAAAKEAVPQARAAILPQISGGWGRTYNRIETQGLPHTSFWQNGWTVSLVQPIFDWTKLLAYRQADYIEALGAVNVDFARQETLLNAVRSYFDTLAAEDEFKRAGDYGAAVDAQIQTLERYRLAGEATVIDLHEAMVSREQVTLQQSDSRNALAAMRRKLEQVTGEPLTALLRLPETLALPRLVPEDADAWASQAADHSYAVQQKQLEWQIAKLAVGKAQGAHYPSVYLSGSYTPAGAASGYARPTTTTTGMLAVSIPLYEGGATTAKVREAEALQEKANEARIGAIRAAEASARDHYSRYQQGRARVDMLAHMIASRREALAATRIGYKVGTRTSTDVLRAIDALYATQRDLLAARYEAVVILLQLKGDTATLSIADLAQLNNEFR